MNNYLKLYNCVVLDKNLETIELCVGKKNDYLCQIKKYFKKIIAMLCRKYKVILIKH